MGRTVEKTLRDARDLNDAIHVTSKIPSARIGTIEVRPVRELARSSRDRSGG